MIWVETDYDADAIMSLLPDAIEVRGSDSMEHKERAVQWFLGADDEYGEQYKADRLCKKKRTSSRTTKKTELDDSESHLTGKKKTPTTGASICESTQGKTLRNTAETGSSAMHTTKSAEKSTLPTKNTEKQQNSRSKSGTKKTQNQSSRSAYENTGYRLTNIGPCLKGNADSAPYVEAKTPDAQKKSACILTTATPPEESEGFCARTAIKRLENSRTLRNCLNGQRLTSGKILVSKPSIFGFGLNLQHCARTAFVGLSFSYEMFYQAVRRFWRFGQERPVECHIAMADTETAIWQTIQRKQRDHEEMKRAMFEAMRGEVLRKNVRESYAPTMKAKLPAWLEAS